MNHKFSLKFDKMRDNNPSAPEGDAVPNLFAKNNYETPGHVRNVCFVMLDGKMIFLNYAYLVAGEHNPENSTITLSFTSHVVILKGYNLEILYADLMFQLCKQVICMDERYDAVEEKDQGSVTEITIAIVE